MSKRPFMRFFVCDYLGDTGHLSTIEHGGYLLLIMHYWQRGSLPDDERLLARIAKMTTAEWEEARSVIRPLFSKGWKHKRIDEELKHVSDVSEKRRDAAMQLHSKRTANVVQLRCGLHTDSDSDSERKESSEEE
jgi:uncharacterized protein YdaU (DUF1376 family)